MSFPFLCVKLKIKQFLSSFVLKNNMAKLVFDVVVVVVVVAVVVVFVVVVAVVVVVLSDVVAVVVRIMMIFGRLFKVAIVNIPAMHVATRSTYHIMILSIL